MSVGGKERGDVGFEGGVAAGGSPVCWVGEAFLDVD